MRFNRNWKTVWDSRKCFVFLSCASEIGQCVPVFGRFFEVHGCGRFFHLLHQFLLNFFSFSGKELARGNNLATVIFKAHVADAWSGAVLEMGVKAVLVIVLAGGERAAPAQIEFTASQDERVAR